MERREAPPPERTSAMIEDRQASADEIRKIILEQSKRAGVGHIGSALSVADILAALYGGTMQIDDPDDPDRDRFVLSKGHASLALYAALHLRGWLSAEQLSTYCSDGTLLGTHPEAALRGVDFSTGSLGHGLSLAAGAALAGGLQSSSRRAFCLLSDAECNEGSVWEAVMFAAHHDLSALVAIVDLNGSKRSDTPATCSISLHSRRAGARTAGTSTRWTATPQKTSHVSSRDSRRASARRTS